jgi:hypothetical protein
LYAPADRVTANCCAIGLNCSEALNALVNRIVCAVGLFDTLVAACFV